MRTKLLLLANACLLLSGCATYKSRDEVLASVKASERICSSELDVAEATNRLQNAWTSCFVAPRGVNVVPIGGSVAMYERSRVIVTNEKAGSSNILIARLAPPPVLSIPSPLSNAIFLMADIRETNECRSEVIVRASNSHWEKRSTQTAAWLANPAAMPKEAECNR